jgi:DNA-binding transcriptional LysR family regulator
LQDRFRVLLPAGHALATRSAIDVAQLIDQRLILLRRGALLRSYTDGALGGLGLTQPVLEVDQMATLVGMVEAGLGVAMVPALGCPSAALRSVVNRPLRRGGVSRPIAFALPLGQAPSGAVQAFVAAALSAVAGASAGLPQGCERLPVSQARLKRFLAATA